MRFKTETIPLDVFLAVPHTDGIEMWEVGLGMGGLAVAALGLAIVERYTDYDVEKINKVFTGSLPILTFLLIGWFFWKVIGSLTPFL